MLDAEILDHRIANAIEMAQESPPLDPAELPYPNSPERMADELGQHVVPYFYRAEVETESANIPDLHVILPGLRDEPFLPVWGSHESGHAAFFSSIAEACGIALPDIDDSVQARMKALGVVTDMSDSIHAVIEQVYLVRGALHEKTTFGAYKQLEKKLTSIGEPEIAEESVKRIIKQEALHLGYYRASAARQDMDLKPWQQYLAKKISEKTFRPVGVRHKPQVIDFGSLALMLFTDTEAEEHAEHVQGVADELLQDGDNPLPRFVVRSLTFAREQAREQQVA